MRPGRLFYFRLAAQLGMTVQELTARLTVGELYEWMAYDQIEPFGIGRQVLQAAMAMRMKLAPGSDVEFTQLVPFYRSPPPQAAKELSEAEHEDMERRMKAYFMRRAGVNDDGSG